VSDNAVFTISSVSWRCIAKLAVAAITQTGSQIDTIKIGHAFKHGMLSHPCQMSLLMQTVM